jgi:hypothetical protein
MPGEGLCIQCSVTGRRVEVAVWWHLICEGPPGPGLWAHQSCRALMHLSAAEV